MTGYGGAATIGGAMNHPVRVVAAVLVTAASVLVLTESAPPAKATTHPPAVADVAPLPPDPSQTNNAWACVTVLVERPYPSYQLTRLSVNVGVIGPVIVYAHTEMAFYASAYGNVIGWVGYQDTGHGFTNIGGINYVPTSYLGGPNVLVQVPGWSTSFTHPCPPGRF